MRTKTIALLTALVILLGTTFVFAAEATDGAYYYAINRVNVRAEPSVDSKSIGVLNEGDIVYGGKTVSDNSGKKWVCSQTKFGTGYVSKNSLAKCPAGDNPSYHGAKAKTLVVAQTVTVRALNGKSGTLKKGTKVSATRFFPKRGGKVEVQLRVGKYDVRVSSTYLRQTNGKKIPSLPTKVRLKKAYNLNGEQLKKGQRLNVEFYFFKGDQLYADVHEGVISCSLLKKA